MASKKEPARVCFMRIRPIAFLAFRLARCRPCLFGIGIARPVVYEIPLPKSRILSQSTSYKQTRRGCRPRMIGTDLGRV